MSDCIIFKLSEDEVRKINELKLNISKQDNISINDITFLYIFTPIKEDKYFIHVYCPANKKKYIIK